MSLQWIRESAPSWDQDKAAIVGGAEKGSLRLEAWTLGDRLPGEWWRVEDAGRSVGYGILDTTWNGAEILLAVAGTERGKGVGSFILERLEEETANHGLNYMFNIVPAEHPRRAAVTSWLEARGFRGSEDGQLRKTVRRPKAKG